MRRFEWRVLFVAGMWFQDLFNYDFRRTEMCIIPYATQMGEISFCAYNTGVGLAQHRREDSAERDRREWYREHGRHKVYAKGIPPRHARTAAARSSVLFTLANCPAISNRRLGDFRPELLRQRMQRK